MPDAASRIAASPKSAAETSSPNNPPNMRPWATCCGVFTLTTALPSAVAARPQIMMRKRNAAQAQVEGLRRRYPSSYRKTSRSLTTRPSPAPPAPGGRNASP